MVERCVTLGSVIYCVGVCVEGQKGENGLQALVSNDGDESEEWEGQEDMTNSGCAILAAASLPLLHA